MTLQPLRMGGLAATTESWFQDEVVDLGDTLALRSPSDPTFRWGNLLILPEPPVPGSRSSWGPGSGRRSQTWEACAT